MKTYAIRLRDLPCNINEVYVDEKYVRDEAAQWIMNNYHKHSIYEEYYYDEKNGKIFHVCSPSSVRGLRCAYEVRPYESAINGGIYKVIGLTIDGNTVIRSYTQFMKGFK